MYQVIKRVKGRNYLQIVENKRVEGKPRAIVLMGLGRYRSVFQALQAPDAGGLSDTGAEGDKRARLQELVEREPKLLTRRAKAPSVSLRHRD